MQVGLQPDIELKVDYLRAENKLFWQKQRKSILLHHYRHSRQYQPICLQAELLKHQTHKLLPLLPTEQMDEFTKATTQFVRDRLPTWYFKLTEYATVWENYVSSMQQIMERHFGKRSERQGWFVNVSPDLEKQKEDF
ncbi:hypothetical protein QNI16_00125 [Cytophagaceae bacterium YF14B1]|uniref:Uncharacterized protein n=1 Tax=Xanthocytophaga flava TaxID=3048013 RepID=A0AAE3U6Q0_9BACT|nr:hypothetical protein [Xanthocytophaga flavus]MDJ1478864.1 hypothetical protein [Xanthocytophaga flavus]